MITLIFCAGSKPSSLTANSVCSSAAAAGAAASPAGAAPAAIIGIGLPDNPSRLVKMVVMSCTSSNVSEQMSSARRMTLGETSGNSSRSRSTTRSSSGSAAALGSASAANPRAEPRAPNARGAFSPIARVASHAARAVATAPARAMPARVVAAGVATTDARWETRASVPAKPRVTRADIATCPAVSLSKKPYPIDERLPPSASGTNAAKLTRRSPVGCATRTVLLSSPATETAPRVVVAGWAGRCAVRVFDRRTESSGWAYLTKVVTKYTVNVLIRDWHHTRFWGQSKRRHLEEAPPSGGKREVNATSVSLGVPVTLRAHSP